MVRAIEIGMETTYSLGNNESFVVGVFPEADGQFLALTSTASKRFKTTKGAEAWLARRGYNPDGTRARKSA